MNKTMLMCKSFKVLHLFVIAALLALTLSAPSAHATPPIGTGQTIEFAGSSAAVSGDTAQIRAVIAVDLDSNGDLDLVTGQSSGTNEVRAWENDGTPFNGAWSTLGAEVGETGTDANALAAADLERHGYATLDAGADAFVSKANSPEEVLEALRTLTKGRRVGVLAQDGLREKGMRRPCEPKRSTYRPIDTIPTELI